jgi:hypothetical protein
VAQLFSLGDMKKFLAFVFTSGFVAGLSWIVFMFVSFRSGGYAISGKIEAGHYYLGQFGQHYPVSRGAYITSAVCTAVLSVWFPTLFWLTALRIWRADSPEFSDKAQTRLLAIPFSFFALAGTYFGFLALRTSTRCILAAIITT